MLEKLHIHNLGPSDELAFQFGDRLNFLTGDNGLGKSFVLDIIWWTLTGTWPGNGRAMRPDEEKAESAKIEWSLSDKLAVNRFGFYNPKAERWVIPGESAESKSDGLVVYARMDGGFSIHFSRGGKGRPKAPLQLSSFDVWEGSNRGGKSRCEGFYRDVSSWLQTDVPQRTKLQDVASVLSPEREPLQFGAPRRVYLEDTRLHPVLKLPYGEVPVAECSAGMRRILALAYVMTWACHEDAERSRLMKTPATGGVTVIIDEIEAHLHPLWQRTIVPALLTALEQLRPHQTHQFHISTHSPMVLASVEPTFDEQRDQLFHFKLEGKKAEVEPIIWAPRGTSSYWLTSPIFGLGEARSREAENAIRAAKDFMMDKLDQLPAGLKSKEQIHAALKLALPGQDPFWPRWMMKTGLED